MTPSAPTKGKVLASTWRFCKRVWEKILLAAHTIVVVEISPRIHVISCRILSSVCCYPEAIPVSIHILSWAITNQIQADFWEPRLLVVSDPRLTTSLSRRCLCVTLLDIVLCNTVSSELCGHWHLVQWRRSLSGLDVLVLAPEVLYMLGTISWAHL